MGRVVWFELPVDDFERARTFYGKVFDWQVEKWQGPMEYWMLMTGKGDPGIDGALTQRSDVTKQTTNTIAVESVDDTIAAVERSGGKLLVPKMEVEGVGWLAYCQDTEGNVFGILHPEMAQQ